MTSEYDTPGPSGTGPQPDELDGHTLDELADYLDRGRDPVDPSIESSPGCRLTLDALERLRALVPELIEDDLRGEPATDESWVERILAGIQLDARAGRSIPIPAASSGSADSVGCVEPALAITEGAVRGIVRAAEAAVPGVLVGRCRLDGEVTEPGAPIRIDVEISVPYGAPMVPLAARLRSEIRARLRFHTPVNVAGIDITVHDVSRPSSSRGDER